jgi:hypothetical protein
VDVDAPCLRGLEDRRRQDQPIRCDNREVGVERAKIRLLLLQSQALWSADSNSESLRAFMDGGLALRLATPRRPRRLAVGGEHFMSCADQGLEARHRELRAAHENDAHQERHCEERSDEAIQFLLWIASLCSQ